MTESRSTRLTRVATARTAVVIVGTTGALGAALAIGVSTAQDKDATVWVPESSDDTGQHQAPYEAGDQDDEDQGLLSRTPAHVSTARPGQQHAQSNGS